MVIGGGCAGVLTARELTLRQAGRVILIDPSAAPGPGVAYGACRPWHLLNSPAGSMSADPQDSGGFVDWARAAGMPASPERQFESLTLGSMA